MTEFDKARAAGEGCNTCKLRYDLERCDYTVGCKHTMMYGFICMAFADEGLACWMVNNDNGMCECYTPKEKKDGE